MSPGKAPPGAGGTAHDYSEWRARVEEELAGEDFDQALVTTTLEGIEIQPLYTDRFPATSPSPRTDTSKYPRDWLLARRSRAARFAPRGWRICQRHDTPDLETLRREVAADLDGGADGIWLELDRAARLGLAADDAEATEAVGKGGATLYSTRDLSRVLPGRDLSGITLIIDAGANAVPAAAIALAAVLGRGIDPPEVRVHLSADPLGSLARDGRLPGSLAEMEAEMTALAAYCATQFPRSRTIGVSAIPYHEGGADSVQELGFAVATGVHYLRLLTAAGVELAAATGQLTFFLAVGRRPFLEIAKLRAMRLLWSKVLVACGLDEPPSPWIHATTSRRTLTQRERWVNLLRVNTQVFAAVLGGADSIASDSFDRALGGPEPKSRRIARNTQIIQAEEAGLGQVLDPMGGSHLIEWLTEALAHRAWEVFQNLERQGGMAACVSSGLVAGEVEASWQRRRERLTQRADQITGVSQYADAPEIRPSPLTSPSKGESESIAREAAKRVAAYREQRGLLLLELGGTGELLVERAVAAATQGATLGELSAALGRSEQAAEAPVLEPQRDSSLFETHVEEGG